MALGMGSVRITDNADGSIGMTVDFDPPLDKDGANATDAQVLILHGIKRINECIMMLDTEEE